MQGMTNGQRGGGKTGGRNGGGAGRHGNGRNRVISTTTKDIAGMRVTIVRKPIKNMYLRIKPPNADIVVSAPQRMSEGAIGRFVAERKPWIERARRTMLQDRDAQIAAQNTSEDGFRRMDDSAGTGMSGTDDSGFHGSSDNPHTFVWTDANKARARRNIESQLPALLAKWQPIIGRGPTHITLRVMTSRWGSCTPRTGRIRLNLQLGLMAPRVLEYVLGHEMTHLWENGHGAGFQRRMSGYLPQWRQLRRDINRHVVL